MATDSLTEWEQNFCAIIRARQPGIVVQSLEEGRVLKSVFRVAQWMSVKKLGTRKLRIWTPVKLSLHHPLETGEDQDTKQEWKEFFLVLKDFLMEMEEKEKEKEKIAPEILVLCDCQHELEQPTNLRLLREALWKVRSTQRVIVLIGKAFDTPDELAADLTILPFALPTVRDLYSVINPQITAFKEAPSYSNCNIDLSQVVPFCRACAGLTENEAKGLTGLAVSRYSAFDMRATAMAIREKASLVRRSNVLDYKTPKATLSEVGGLEYAKAWISEQDTILQDVDAARAYGCRAPRGLLCAGVPGTGKSLLAEALAGHWQIPLLQFDLGRAFGSLLGQTEAAVQQVITMTTACAPVCLQLEEIEKTLGGGGGEMDGGTGNRVRAKLLTWLQEKPDGVFVIATANDIQKFERSPELLRAGRFDKIFFCDLPDLRARLEILAIHYRKALNYALESGKCMLAKQIPADTLMAAALAARGYSGAELEVVMQTALRYAFNSNPRSGSVTSEMLVAAVKTQTPLSVTMKESIAALRQWVKSGRAMPAGATIEDDNQKSDSRSLENYGLPDVLGSEGG